MTATIRGPIWYGHSETSDEQPRPSRTTTLNGFLSLVNQLADAGLPPPDEFTQLQERLSVLQGAVHDGGGMMHRLLQAVLHGPADDIETCYVMALAEHNRATAVEDVLTPIHNAIRAELAALYPAAAHFRVLRDRFNSLANRFIGAAGVIDPGASADEAVAAGDRALAAWKDATRFGDEMDAMVEVVVAAAELVRNGEPSGLGVSRIPLEINLFCDADGLHRRELWAAWLDQPVPQVGGLTTENLVPQPHQATRCGRWTRLLRLGAPICVIENPAGMPMYGAPGPMGRRQIQPPGDPLNPKKIWQQFDPCDAELEQARPKGPRAALAWLRRRHKIDEPVGLLDTIPDIDEETPHGD
jgi:hypothetical protein